MATTVDKVDNSYCYYLVNHTRYIWSLVNNKDITLDHMVAIVLSFIKKSQWTDKRVKFTKRLNELEDKQSIAYYVSNSCKKAQETIAQ